MKYCAVIYFTDDINCYTFNNPNHRGHGLYRTFNSFYILRKKFKKMSINDIIFLMGVWIKKTFLSCILFPRCEYKIVKEKAEETAILDIGGIGLKSLSSWHIPGVSTQCTWWTVTSPPWTSPTWSSPSSTPTWWPPYPTYSRCRTASGGSAF